MKPIPVFILIIVLCLGGSFVFTHVMKMPSREDDSTTERLRSQIDSLSGTINELVASNRELTERMQALSSETDAGEILATREPMVSVEEAVDRWIRENRPDLLPADQNLDREAATTEELDLQRAGQMLALLSDPELDDQGWNEVWKKISEAGLLDEALALLEENVAKDPNNADAHVALAGGYIGLTMNTANDMEKGMWAIKADQTLNRALELNPMHWDARFTKAISLTFYPPVMGKQGEAMKHFEILLEQQKNLPPKPSHAQTYLYLGNLHSQLGNHDKASQIWKDGIGLFPDNAELLEQLKNALKD